MWPVRAPGAADVDASGRKCAVFQPAEYVIHYNCRNTGITYRPLGAGLVVTGAVRIRVRNALVGDGVDETHAPDMFDFLCSI